MTDENLCEMVVAGLVLDPDSNAPIVILKDPQGDTCLPIWIGLAEATAIASALKKVEPIRPMTHDLLCSVINSLGGDVIRIVVTGLNENTFYAAIEVRQGEMSIQIDSRPSDAIALGVRLNVPIMVDAEVLDQAQVRLVAAEGEEGELVEAPSGPPGPDDKNFATIEKDKWADILATMDPDDFKYKM